MKIANLFLVISILAGFTGGLTPKDAVRVEGVVLDPEGMPVRGARVTAVIVCGVVVLDEVGSTETDNHGKFSLKIVPGHCDTVRLHASKEEDFWLKTGFWEDELENPGTAPVIELSGEPDPVEINLGSRGGKLFIEATDKDDAFWPAEVFLHDCDSGGGSSSIGWISIDANSPSLEMLLPEGSYCAGISSANGMYPKASACTAVELVPGQAQHVKLMIDPLELTTEFVAPLRRCSPSEPDGP
jgi:hypothetical protein